MLSVMWWGKPHPTGMRQFGGHKQFAPRLRGVVSGKAEFVFEVVDVHAAFIDDGFIE